MKKILGFILCFFTLFSVSACGNNVDPDLILPGKDRLLWDASFNNIDEVKDFIIKLKNAQKNGDFNFGICDFKAPIGYKIFSLTFNGYIDINASKEDDIYNSIYDYFEIKLSFHDNIGTLPAYNRFDIYFYPFYLEDLNFINSKIEHSVLDHYNGSCMISFTYGETVLMKVNLSAESNSKINKENLIDELSNNYMLVV